MLHGAVGRRNPLKGSMEPATIIAVVGSLGVIGWSMVAVARELGRPDGPDRDALLTM